VAGTTMGLSIEPRLKIGRIRTPPVGSFGVSPIGSSDISRALLGRSTQKSATRRNRGATGERESSPFSPPRPVTENGLNVIYAPALIAVFASGRF
jgi:hypothetical protein